MNPEKALNWAMLAALIVVIFVMADLGLENKRRRKHEERFMKALAPDSK